MATLIAEIMNFLKGFLLARRVEYRSKDNCTFPTECVCLYVCSHIIKTTWPNFKCSNLCMSTMAVAWYSSKYSLWVGTKSAIYDCLVIIAPVPCPLPPAIPPYVRILAPPMIFWMSVTYSYYNTKLVFAVIKMMVDTCSKHSNSSYQCVCDRRTTFQ